MNCVAGDLSNITTCVGAIVSIGKDARANNSINNSHSVAPLYEAVGPVMTKMCAIFWPVDDNWHNATGNATGNPPETATVNVTEVAYILDKASDGWSSVSGAFKFPAMYADYREYVGDLPFPTFHTYVADHPPAQLSSNPTTERSSDTTTIGGRPGRPLDNLKKTVSYTANDSQHSNNYLLSDLQSTTEQLTSTRVQREYYEQHIQILLKCLEVALGEQDPEIAVVDIKNIKIEMFNCLLCFMYWLIIELHYKSILLKTRQAYKTALSELQDRSSNVDVKITTSNE